MSFDIWLIRCHPAGCLLPRGSLLLRSAFAPEFFLLFPRAFPVKFPAIFALFAYSFALSFPNDRHINRLFLLKKPRAVKIENPAKHLVHFCPGRRNTRSDATGTFRHRAHPVASIREFGNDTPGANGSIWPNPMLLQRLPPRHIKSLSVQVA